MALAEERRRRKEEKAIRIEAEEEMRRAQDQRDKSVAPFSLYMLSKSSLSDVGMWDCTK